MAVGEEPPGLQDDKHVQEQAAEGGVRGDLHPGGDDAQRGGPGQSRRPVHRRHEDRVRCQQVHVRLEEACREEQGQAGGTDPRRAGRGRGGRQVGGGRDSGRPA